MSRWIVKSCFALLVTAVSLSGTALAQAEWPGFRGPDRTGSINGRLIDGDTAGLTLGWKRALGPGYSAPAVGGGRVVVMFAAGDDDVVAAFDVESGEELWRYPIAPTYTTGDLLTALFPLHTGVGG